MKIEVSDYYKNQYKNAYVVTNKEQRRICILRDYNNKLHSMSYAKYLYTSYYKYEIPDGCQIDHINGDKTDDRIENLQCISAEYNIRKDRKRGEMIMLVCPICRKHFLFPKHNVKQGQEHCCSRSCGGKKSILTTIKKYGIKVRKTSICKYRHKKFPYVEGKLYCSKKCRELDKGYPSYEEINTDYSILKSWELVAKKHKITTKILRRIRKQGEKE